MRSLFTVTCCSSILHDWDNNFLFLVVVLMRKERENALHDSIIETSNMRVVISKCDCITSFLEDLDCTLMYHSKGAASCIERALWKDTVVETVVHFCTNNFGKIPVLV